MDGVHRLVLHFRVTAVVAVVVAAAVSDAVISGLSGLRLAPTSSLLQQFLVLSLLNAPRGRALSDCMLSSPCATNLAAVRVDARILQHEPELAV